MPDEALKMLVDVGSSAVIAAALLRGLIVAEKVVIRLLDTIDRICITCVDDERRH